jgi:hypothetical protein
MSSKRRNAEKRRQRHEEILAMDGIQSGDDMSGEQPADPYTHWRRRAETAEDRVRDLEAENFRLNMEMVAYREKLTPADAAAMTAVMNSLYAEKKWRDAQHWGPCGNPTGADAAPKVES